VKQFSHLYNYPIHLQSKIPESDKKIKIISESVSVHYHRIFREKHAKAILTPLIDPNDDKSRWLIENLVNLRLLEKENLQSFALSSKNISYIVENVEDDIKILFG
jgi:hypothetical protein